MKNDDYEFFQAQAKVFDEYRKTSQLHQEAMTEWERRQKELDADKDISTHPSGHDCYYCLMARKTVK